MRRAAIVVAVLVAAAAVPATAEPGANGRFVLRATVTSVADGDTVRVRLASGQGERVRLIGIDAPETGDCLSRQATAAARRLALGRDVTLLGDGTQATRDRYGRLLAYVWLPGGHDLGFRMIALGLARVYVYERPFARLGAYRQAERIGLRQNTNVWRGCRP